MKVLGHGDADLNWLGREPESWGVTCVCELKAWKLEDQR